MSFMLAEALQRLDSCCDPDKRVYAIETANRRRKYTIQTPEETWRDISCQPVSHYYEVLSGPCNLYLDIEWMSTNKCHESEEHDKVQHIVQHVCNQLKSTYGEEQPIITKASASGLSAKGFKSSWHVHISCKKVCWLNPSAVGDFVKSSCEQFPEVDKHPYAGTGQNWRCVGSSKITEPQRKFVPVNHQTFLGCTVQQPVADRKIIYPNVLVQRSVHCKPWVRELAESLHAGGTPQMCADNRCVVPFRQRQFCTHAQRVHRSNHQYAVINLDTLMWKMSCHACADALFPWQTFPLDVLTRAFQHQCGMYQGTAPLPAVKQCNGQATLFDLHANGPPPRLCQNKQHATVQCSDGLYKFFVPHGEQ